MSSHLEPQSNKSEGSKQGKQSCLKSDKILQFDKFGQTLSFNFHNGSSVYRSSIGTCFSLLIGLITVVFTAQQCLVLFKRKATVFTSSPILGYNQEDYVFNQTDGLRFAFFLFDSSSPDLVDSLGRSEEEIGTL